MPALAEEREYSYYPEQTFNSRSTREVIGSDAFNLEHYTNPTKGELRRDIIAYLAEYRLQVPKYPYELISGRDNNKQGAITLRDKDRGGPLQHKAKRAIEVRKLRGDPIHRQEAEGKGLNLLQEQLAEAKTGSTILWASPPGPKEQGFDDYGFIYAGRITKLDQGEAHLAMSAIRIEKPSLAQYNNALSELSGEDIYYRSAEEFIAKPKVIAHEIPAREIDIALQEHFSFKTDEKKQERFAVIIDHMTPMIDDFIEVCGTGSKQEKLKALHALENYSLKLKKEEDAAEKANAKIIFQRSIQFQDVRLYHVIKEYGYTPPVVPGSCGSTGESSGLVSMRGGEKVSVSIFGSDNYGSREFKCPSCNQTNKREANELLKNCQHCGSDKVAC